MPSKRVDIIRLRMVKESSILYPARRINTPADAVSLLNPFLEEADRETTIAVFLNVKNEPIAIHVISVGTLTSSLLHPREVFKAAQLCNAASLY